MKKFQFKLQPYLSLCRQREEVESLLLVELQTKAEQIHRRISELESFRSQIESELNFTSRTIASHDLALFQNCLKRIQEQMPGLLNDRSRAEAAVREQQNRLRAAIQKRIVLERLKERRRQGYSSELNLKERREIEDLFLLTRSFREKE